MAGRVKDVAALAGVAEDQVEQVDKDTVIEAMTGKMDHNALAFATAEDLNVWYWKVGGRYFLDDPFFGPVTDFKNLSFDDDMGLSADVPGR